MSLKNITIGSQIKYSSLEEIDVDVYRFQLNQEKYSNSSSSDNDETNEISQCSLKLNENLVNNNIYQGLSNFHYDRNNHNRDGNDFIKTTHSPKTIESIIKEQPTPLVDENQGLEHKLEYTPWHIREGKSLNTYNSSQNQFIPLPYYKRR